ncbi:Rrf2 family transcriptional regulator [bacterium]|nr:Rrf2 family transcriptional regulator [bacterium]
MHHFFWLSNALFMAFHSLAIISKARDRKLTTANIATALGVSFNHLQKVHQKLVHAGIIRSVRGPGGGFELNKPASEITLFDVFIAVEGQYADCECLLQPGDRLIDHSSHCVLGDFLQQLDQLIKNHLQTVTLDQFSKQCKISIDLHEDE